jgi:hypothetical protein
MSATIDGTKIEGPTDDRGRIYLGSEYANKNVELLILDSDEKDENTQ